MSLILAIEADKRQATLLASIGRRVGAELVIAPTAERGLDAIDGRVPDLILTSALLSPRDDAAITSRLRELDSAASHVQTLTMPVLAKPARRTQQPAGLLGKLRGAPTSSAPVGCDPALFADQVTEYLERAAAERQAREEAHAAAKDAAPVVAATRTATVAEAPVEAIEPAAWRQPPAPSLTPATGEPNAPYIVSAAGPNPIVIAPIVVANVSVELPDVQLADCIVLPAEPAAAIEMEHAAVVQPAPWRVLEDDGTSVVDEKLPVEAIAIAPAPVGDIEDVQPAIEAAEPEPAPMAPAVASAGTETLLVDSTVIASAPETVITEVAAREEPVALPAVVLSEAEPVVSIQVVVTEAEMAVDAPVLTTEAEPVVDGPVLTTDVEPEAVAGPDEPAVVLPIAASEAEPTIDVRASAPAEPEPTAPAPKAEAEEVELIEELKTPPDVVELNADALSIDIDAALREFEAALADAEALAAADHHATSAPPAPRVEEAIDRVADVTLLARHAAPAAAPRTESWAELARTTALWPALEGLAAEMPPPKPVEAPVAAVASAPVAVVNMAPPVAAVPAAAPAAEPVVEAVAPPVVEAVVAPIAAVAPVVVAAPVAAPVAAVAPAVEPPVAPAPMPESPARPPLTVAPAANESAAKPAAEPRPKKKRKPKPVQDEWGLFDPDQCGFAALLDKLNQLSADDAA